MSDHQIGISEVYGAVRSLENKLDAFMLDHSVKVALLDQRVTTVEKKQEDAVTRKWQLYLTLLTAVIAIGLAVLGILLK